MLRELYGTDRPTMDMIVRNMGFVEDLERGQGIYVLIYQDGKPSQISLPDIRSIEGAMATSVVFRMG